jgi:hypothetical protein
MRDPQEQLPAEFDRLRSPSPAYAPRKVVVYLCTREHLVSVPFAIEAETPQTWECRCGQPATLVDRDSPDLDDDAPAAAPPVGDAAADLDDAPDAPASTG